MTNPTEKIKEIEKELIALKGLDIESEPCWAFRDVEASIFKLEAKLQVYKEWEESLSNTNHTNHTNDIEQKLAEYWQEMGRQQREAEILEMIDEWWNKQDDGDVDEYNVGYVKIYPHDLEELKDKIKGEKRK